jgi:tetratricopeptide (TPR) repeat protein
MRKLFFIFISFVIIAGGWGVHTYEHLLKSEVTESAIKQLVAEGEKAMDIGHYQQAMQVFQEELKNNPQNVEAAWGFKKAQVRATLSGDALKQAVAALFQENPNDSHINLFLGEFQVTDHALDKARLYYQTAIELDPKLAEAYFLLAALYEQQGYLNEARVEYLKAIALSPEARYQNSLATIYFKQQRYEAAVKEYGKNLEYPLSSLESAKIFWRLGYLSQALNYQRQAIEFLENKRVMAKLENQEDWIMEIVPGQVLKLSSLSEKKSYGYLSLAATLYLHGDAEEADTTVQKVRQFKLSQQAEINRLVKANLDALLKGNADVAELVESFKKHYF